MNLEEKKQKLEEYGKLLLGEGGFFESMPEDQKDAFGEALMLMAEIKAYEIIQEHIGGGFEINLNLPSIDLGNLISINPKPVYREEEHYEMPPSYCGGCHQDPCMCNNEPWKCDGCQNEHCTCEVNDPAQMEMDMTYEEPMVEEAVEEEVMEDGTYEEPMVEESMMCETCKMEPCMCVDTADEAPVEMCPACNMEPCMCANDSTDSYEEPHSGDTA